MFVRWRYCASPGHGERRNGWYRVRSCSVKMKLCKSHAGVMTSHAVVAYLSKKQHLARGKRK
jgi:hypothetical protein